MKAALVFSCGFICGVLAAIALAIGISYNDDEDIDMPGLTLFEEKGECVSNNNLEVLQVLEPNFALVYERGAFFGGLTMLITNDKNKVYYDGQVINLSKGTCWRSIGIYQYKSKGGDDKTVPVVVME